MSYNQSRADRSDSSQYKKAGQSSGFSQRNNNYYGSTGKGGDAAAPPISSNLQQSQSFNKKSNNVQGGQSGASGFGLISSPDSNGTPANRPAPNGSHSQPPVPAPGARVTGNDVKRTADQPAQRSAQVVQKAPSSQATNVKPDPAPHATSTKAPVDASKPFPIQFGSVSPGTLNGPQIPARTNSAPPNLVEQQRDQARRDSLRQVQQFPIPSVPKQQIPRKDGGTGDQLKTGEAHQIPMAKRDIHVPSASTVSQTQKAPVHNISGISMPMPFHQQQVPVQFGGPTPQIRSQVIGGASLPMPMPLPMGSAQLPQSVYVSGLHPHPHPMQGPGIIHQGQGLNFTSHMGPRMPTQLGNMGMGAGPQYPQLQQMKFVASRKAVRITHPDTHEELRLENATGPRSHQNVPQDAQSATSVPPARPLNYYSNPFFYSAQGSGPLNSAINPASQQPPRFGFPVSQGSQTASLMNPSHKPSILDGSQDIQKAMPSVAPTSVQVTIKPATGVHGEKMNDLASCTSPVGKVASQKQGEASSIHPQSDSGSCPSSSSHRPKPLAVPPDSLEETAPAVVHSTETRKKEMLSRSDSIKDQVKMQNTKGSPQSPPQVPEQSTVLSLSSQSPEHTNSFTSVTSEALATERTAPTSSGRSLMESTRELLFTDSASGDLPGPKSDSTTSSGAKAVVVNLTTEPLGEHNDISTPVEPLDHKDIGAKGGKMLDDGVKEEDNNSKTPSGSICSTCSEAEIQTEMKSNLMVRNNSPEVGSLEIAVKGSEGSIDNCKKDNSLASPASIVLDAGESISTLNTLTSSDGDRNVSAPESAAGENEILDIKPAVVAMSIVADDGVAPVDVIPSPELTLRNEEGGAMDISTGLVSFEAVSDKEKPVAELNRSKSSGTKGKKKLKEISQKADAAGKTLDLYNAYKGPEEKKETVTASEGNDSKEVLVDSMQDVCSSEKDGVGKAEPDDWEDAVDISTPKLETDDNVNIVSGELSEGIGLMAKKYTRDFLLKFSQQYTDLPKGFKFPSNVADALMVPSVNATRESCPSPGRGVDWSPGGRRGGLVGDDRWNKTPSSLNSSFQPGQGGNVLRNPRGLTPAHYAGGILSGPMQAMGSHGGVQRSNSDADRWQRATGFQKGLISPPTTPVPVMHKAGRKYQVGNVADEEEAKQRQLKAILNKLTPQNFEKLFEQVKAVKIDNAVTLKGVISQIFDKALMEPTFCEMYANFCCHLAGELPGFSDDNEKITFRRVLLNKCQEEFERGMLEQEEADRVDTEGEVKQSSEERGEKRIRARRRMLGNIRLIGELYKKKMLTEKIMHECIKTLLGQYENPDEEDIEALCKLMSTIGEMIDHPRAKEHMDAYFDMMSKLSNNMKLSSRVRFMLKDAIDLRKNKWQQRRKVEGPKKIEEVHRDAAQERHLQAGRLARGPGSYSSGRSRQPMDFSSRGSSMLPSLNSQVGGYRGLQSLPRGYGLQDARIDDRHSFESRTLSVQRPLGEDSIMLGPQGGLARVMSTRGLPSNPNTPFTEASIFGDLRRVGPGVNGSSSVPDRYARSTREDLVPRCTSERVTGPYDQAALLAQNMSYGTQDVRNADQTGNRSRPSSPNVGVGGIVPPHTVSSDKVWPEERLREMSLSTIKEFYSAKDEKEVALCVKDLNAPSFYPTMISLWISDSFERKDMERESLAELLTNLSKSRDSLLNHDDLVRGFQTVLSTLEDALNDAPKAGEFLGRIFAKIIIEDVIPFSEIGQLVFEGGEEQGSLVEVGLAAEVVAIILEIVKLERGESFLNEIRTSSGSNLERFRPPNLRKPSRLDKFI